MLTYGTYMVEIKKRYRGYCGTTQLNRRRMLRTKFIPLLFLCFTTTIMAQTSLSGKVTDADTKDPILFGAVVVYQNGILKSGTETDFDGNYNFRNLDPGTYDVEFSYLGYQTLLIEKVTVIDGKAIRLNAEIESSKGIFLEEVVVRSYKVPLIEQDNFTSGQTLTSEQIRALPTRNINGLAPKSSRASRSRQVAHHSETTEFSTRKENGYLPTEQEAISTFGIDVDRAAYSIVRSYLQQHRIPPAEAVRTEEMVNYFSYDYPQPVSNAPFSVSSELAVCPWNLEHLLLSVAIQGEDKSLAELPPSNLTFLIDVSGSMGAANKLPLVIKSMTHLVEQLRPEDQIAIVVYAGASGVALPPTKVAEKETILAALNILKSGGSTAGGAGIELAYSLARDHFVPKGNNRVILATDGDFNVGVSSVEGLETLIEREKESGVFLTVLGFGMGNLKDNHLERLADKGNGTYAYIDTEEEAQKVFGQELTSSLYTIAKDVKLQLEFNAANISAYRLIGYENRLLNEEDFTDDTNDAGELGAGHSVTAFYELIPTETTTQGGAIGTLALRYKPADKNGSKELTHQLSETVLDVEAASDNFRWAAAVAAYSLVLQRSEYQGLANYELVNNLAESAVGEDRYGLRRAFLLQLDKTMILEEQQGQ